MKLIPKITFLLRQEEGNVDVIAHEGIRIEVTPAEQKKFASYFFAPESKEGKAKESEVADKNKALKVK